MPLGTYLGILDVSNPLFLNFEKFNDFLCISDIHDIYPKKVCISCIYTYTQNKKSCIYTIYTYTQIIKKCIFFSMTSYYESFLMFIGFTRVPYPSVEHVMNVV